MPHVPIRTCVVCKAKRSKKELLRIGKTKAGMVRVGGSEGRGVYLCPSNECIETAIRKRVIVYPLRLGNSSVDWKRLESELMKALSERNKKEERT